MLLFFASRQEVDVEALVERTVKEQLAQAQAELASELDLREKQHDRELEERWTKGIQGAEERVLAEQQRQQELEKERRQAEQREQEERRAKELEEKEREARKKTQEAEEKRKLEEAAKKKQEKEKEEEEEKERKQKEEEEVARTKAEEVAAAVNTEKKFTPEGIPYLSSLPRLQPVPNERLDSLLKSRASSFAIDGQPEQTGKDVILVVFNKSYVELLSNLLCTLRKLDLLPHVVGIALDEEALAECPGLGVECVLPAAPFLRAASGSFHYHGNGDFKSLSKLKSRNVLEVLLRGYNVLLVDGDIVFFRDPLPTLRNGSREFDLQIQSDSPHAQPKNAYLNSGMYYVVANKKSIDFMSVLWEFGRTTAVNASEQVSFSRLVDRMEVGKAPGLRLHRNNLELHEFCNGDSYFSPPPEGANGVYVIRPDASDHCYILHFNWIYGGNKLKTMKGNKFWFIDDAGQCLA